DELFAKLGGLSFAEQIGLSDAKIRLALLQTPVELELRRDQLPQQLERTEDFGLLQLARLRIDRAERAPDRSVALDDRRGNVAPEAVHRRRRVIAEGAVGLDVVDDDGLPVLADLVADGGFDLQLAAFLEAEADLVANRTAHPLARGDAGDGDEAHPGHAADHVQDFRDGANLLDRVDFRLDIDAHNDWACPLISEITRWGYDCSGNERAAGKLDTVMPEWTWRNPKT